MVGNDTSRCHSRSSLQVMLDFDGPDVPRGIDLSRKIGSGGGARVRLSKHRAADGCFPEAPDAESAAEITDNGQSFKGALDRAELAIGAGKAGGVNARCLKRLDVD